MMEKSTFVFKFLIITLNFCFFSFTWSYFFRSNCWPFHIFNLKMEFCWFKAVWVNAFTPWAVRPSRRWTWLSKMWKRLLTNVDYAFAIGKPAKNNRRIILRCSRKVATSDWKSKLVLCLTFQEHVTPKMNSNGSYEWCKPLWRFLKHVKEWIDQQAKIDDDRWCW